MENIFTRVSQYLDIDSKLKLGVPPNKIPSEVISNFNLKFPRPTVVYMKHARKLFSFYRMNEEHPGIYILGNIDTLSIVDEYLYSFGSNGVISYEYVSEKANTINFLHGNNCNWVTELKPKIIESV